MTPGTLALAGKGLLHVLVTWVGKVDEDERQGVDEDERRGVDWDACSAGFC